MRLRPFFSFYGSKYRLAPLYPRPIHPRIIEPFAGGAGYSTRYHTWNVALCDTDPQICGVWDFLIRASQCDILDLPIVQNIDDLPDCVSQEARWWIGFWFGRCGQSARKQLSAWGRTGKYDHAFWSARVRKRIAHQVRYIRHWRVYNRGYETLLNPVSTWFIDPPYCSDAGRAYRSNQIDYHHLARWSQERHGQVIVCEHNGASWLPFSHLRTIDSCRGKGKTGQRSAESVWVNTTTDDMR